MNNEAFQKIVDAITEAYGVCAEEIIQYEIQTSKMWLVFFAITLLLTVTAMIAVYIRNKKRDMSWSDEEFSIFVNVTGIILSTILIFMILIQIDDIYTATYFPEKALIYHIKETIRNLRF